MLKNRYSDKLEAGCDEAGRGCLAGPVVAAAVILPEDFSHPVLNDSKKLSEKQRKELKHVIMNSALAWAHGVVDHTEIDKINILNASIEAMHRAIANLNLKPEFLIIDGNRFHPYRALPHECIVKGDSKYASIAAASVLAKTHRDELMEALHKEYPNYDWKRNKGYPTSRHREAIAAHGSSPYHRMSFKLLADPVK
ncbi:MAG TPA: ribonuclease HII [Flavobacteriales bacterium]|nr:ribonuclease HII [Flavobacteriales bacterium]